MIYFIIFFVLIAFAFFEYYYKDERRVEITIIFWSSIAFLILFGGFRMVGFDYDNYQRLFDEVDFLNYKENTIEVGFAAIISLFRYLYIPFNFYLFFIALVSVSLKARFINDFSPYCITSLLVYYTVNFLLSDMGQMRHGLAMSIILMAFYDIFKTNKKGFFSKVFVAYLFHSSAIIVFPAYFIANLKKVTLWHLLIPMLFALPFMFIDIRAILLVLALFSPENIQSKIAYYTTSEEFGAQLGFNLTTLFRFVILITMYVYYDKGIRFVKYYKQFFLLYLYGTLLFMVFNSVAEMALRFSNYFKILEFVILPMFISLSRSIFEKHLIIAIIIAYAIWSIYKMLFDQYTSVEYLPYRNLILGD